MQTFDATKPLVTALIRALLKLLFASLITKGFLTDGEVNASAAEIAIGVIGFIASFGWSVWDKIKTKYRLNEALQSPPGTPVAEVKRGAAAAIANDIKGSNAPLV